MSLSTTKAREIRRTILVFREWQRQIDVLFDNPKPATMWQVLHAQALVHELHRTRTGRAVVDKFMARGDRQ